MSTLTSITSDVSKSIFKILVPIIYDIEKFLNFSNLSQLLQLELVEATTLAKIKWTSLPYFGVKLRKK